MKARISYTTMSGELKSIETERWVDGGNPAKRELAAHLDLVAIDSRDGGEDIDGRLRNGGIDPDSIAVSPLP